MKNLFRRLLELEFGEREYLRLLRQILSEREEKFINMSVTWQIAEHLQKRRQTELMRMSHRLDETLLHSYQIHKGFLPFVVFSLGCIGLLLLRVTSATVWIPALFGIMLCNAYRFQEFYTNKHCYADAKLILCYRIALEDCLQELPTTKTY